MSSLLGWGQNRRAFSEPPRTLATSFWAAFRKKEFRGTDIDVRTLLRREKYLCTFVGQGTRGPSHQSRPHQRRTRPIRRPRHPTGGMGRHGHNSPTFVSGFPIDAIAKRTLLGVIVKGLPPTRPRARADARPATVRSEISSRSHSARAAKIPKTSFPAAVVVSIAAP